MQKEHNSAGEYSIVWDGRNDIGTQVSSGTYFYQLVIGSNTSTKKMILLK
ncbi:MAG: hypothetical protein IPH11_04885 [Ignavibacteriales bacterium]|nr:hypothetical protein [Ignavibacteriales bacterium]